MRIKNCFFLIIFQKPEVFVSVFPTQSTQLIPNCSIVSFPPLLQPSVLYFRLCPFMIFYLIYWAILTLLYSSVVLDFRWREIRQLKCSGQKVWTLASKLRASFINTELNAECELILFIHTESLVAVGDSCKLCNNYVHRTCLSGKDSFQLTKRYLLLFYM